MMMMMISTTTQSPCNQSSPTSPPWKLYHNPFYNCILSNCSNISSMETELEEARAQIIELEAELEFERRLRKKMECLANRIAEELEEERRGREAAERVCEELCNRVSGQRAEIGRIRRDMDEERKMMRVAEVFREERLQMKLVDAKIFYEEKLLGSDRTDYKQSKTGDEEEEEWCVEGGKRWISSENERLCGGGGGGGGYVSPVSVQRRLSPDPENPHIKRGIKGSVEFQRVVRALCSNKGNRHLGESYNKLECQKAQLKVLLKQKSSIQPNSLISS